MQAMVIDLCEISKERTSRSKRNLPSIDLCADVLPVQERMKAAIVNPKRRIESLDGASPSREDPQVIPEYYKGIHLMNMNSILRDIFGQSCCGRIRITLHDDAVRHSVLRNMCERLLQCSSEVELVKLLMRDCSDAIKFKFYYAGKDNLSDCMKGD